VGGNTANQTTECRLTCNAQVAATGDGGAASLDCPFNYHCEPGPSPTTSYCVKDRPTGTFNPTAKGEAAAGAPWGVPCDPLKGLNTNSDCDTAQQFWCYGTSTTDANAFCTQEQCSQDGDCPQGWWCATVNDEPNVTTNKRTDWGTTTTVCMPRTYNLKPGTYCAPCKTDLDCPLNAGITQHCVSADNNGGAELVCATECAKDANCPEDYTCQASAAGPNVCVPRAATCKGDGSFCSPCHSDADCMAGGGGYCLQADYSTEHFCTVPTSTCSYNTSTGFTDMCPALPAKAQPPTTTTDGVGCSYSGSSFTFPLNQCYAGGPYGLQCYSYHCVGSGNVSCGKNSDCCSNSCDTATNTCN